VNVGGDLADTEEFDELGAIDDLADLGLWLDRKTWTGYGEGVFGVDVVGLLEVIERVESCDDGASARKLQSSCLFEQLAHTGCFPSHCVNVSISTAISVDFA
jgi:hypothetical protein